MNSLTSFKKYEGYTKELNEFPPNQGQIASKMARLREIRGAEVGQGGKYSRNRPVLRANSLSKFNSIECLLHKLSESPSFRSHSDTRRGLPPAEYIGSGAFAWGENG